MSYQFQMHIFLHSYICKNAFFPYFQNLDYPKQGLEYQQPLLTNLRYSQRIHYLATIFDFHIFHVLYRKINNLHILVNHHMRLVYEYFFSTAKTSPLPMISNISFTYFSLFVIKSSSLSIKAMTNTVCKNIFSIPISPRITSC